MSIARHGTTDGAKGLPIISRAVVRGDTVYLCGVTPDSTGDITSQTKQVLDRTDHLRHQGGTDKSQLLTAQVWLSDMRLFEAHNGVWNARGVPAACRYVRASRPTCGVPGCRSRSW